MKVKLYKAFNHWQEKGVIWLISDPHFNDADCKLMDPKWPSADEQVKMINSLVGKKDTLICLGDVGDESYVKKLKGYKVLLTGNHDRGITNYQKKFSVVLLNDPERRACLNEQPIFIKQFDSFKEADDYREAINAKDFMGAYRVTDDRMFDEVYNGPLFINDKILLSHEPVELGFGFNIHGHVHGGKKVDFDPNCPGFYKFNLASDVIGYKPVRLDKLIEGYDAVDLHRVTIDWATERKNSK